jgi:hypothetical protein
MFGKSKENPMEKDKKKTLSKSSKTAVINTNPQLPGVNEQGSAVAKDPVVEKVLNLAQRRKRALVMKKNEPKLERARALAKTRFAPEIRLKKRAQEMARTIVRRKVAGQRGIEYATLSPSDKINVDKMLDKKVALIKKIADRLMPRIKKSEAMRLQQVRTGKKAVQQGALGQSTLMQSVDDVLLRKSEKSGIPFEIISEVFKRGYDAWAESMTHSAQQNAFNRVNSYIAGGKARELDADLIEKEVWDKPNPVQKAGKSSKLSPAAKAKAKARAKAAGRAYPNMVDNIWAARNEEVTNEGIIGDALKNAAAQQLTKQGGTLGAAIAKKILKKKKTNEETQLDEYGPTNWQITQAANRADKALDKKYKYGTTKGEISPIAGRRRQQGFGAQANFNSAEAGLNARGNTRTKADAVHRGWSKTVKQMPAPDAKKQAAREKLKKTPFFKLSRDEQEKDVVLAKALKKEETAIETKPKLKDKTVKRELYKIQTKSMDPMTESSHDKKPLLSKIKKMVKK